MKISPIIPARYTPAISKILFCLIIICSTISAQATGIKFKIKNTAKTNVAVFYRINKKSGSFKLKTLLNLKPGEEKIKDISVEKGDTIAFYGQDAEDETSV